MHPSISFLLNHLSRNRRFSYKKIMLIPKSSSLQVLYYKPNAFLLRTFFINLIHPNYVVSRVYPIMHPREVFYLRKNAFEISSRVNYPLNIYFHLKNIKNFAKKIQKTKTILIKNLPRVTRSYNPRPS